MLIRKRGKATLTAIEMDLGDELEFVRTDGSLCRIILRDTSTEILSTTLKKVGLPERNARTIYTFTIRLEIEGRPYDLRRVVGTQESFYEPWEIEGLHFWPDAVAGIFSFLQESHGPCRPRKAARFALQEAGLRICPPPLLPWCPLPPGRLRIEDCYRGEDCWLGAYDGADAHGGLDINHPPGTPIRAPLDIHDHFYFDSVAAGQNNNRWRGFHRWEDGSTWVLQCHHMTRLTVPEHVPIPAGGLYADGAGVLSGAVDHSHFVFKVAEGEEEISLDPWILFWQMYRDLAAST